jgi:hypothetical protein
MPRWKTDLLEWEEDGKEPVRSGYFDVISLLADNTDKTQTKLGARSSAF